MSNVDISQLAVNRDERKTTNSAPRRRGWLTRIVFPILLLTAFVGLLGWAAKDSILPSKPVTIVPVVVARAEVHQADTPLFQAAGWIEPRPVSTVVTSLTEGVVEELYVVAGQSVVKGEVIARLIAIDSRIALDEARAELRLREAEMSAATAELESADLAFDNPIQMQADLAQAEATLSQVEAELQGIPSAIQAAQTQYELATETLAKKEQAGGAVAGRVLREAKSQLAGISATLQSLEIQQPELKQQRDALSRRRNAMAERLELRLEQKRRVADSRSSLNVATARRDQASLAVESAELRMSRLAIKSPMNGRVLSVLTSPGRRVNGLNPNSEQGASAVATLYDPLMLQVRVDVRLEDVPQVQLGQSARIETASAPGEILGEVIAVTSQADIQKNTLQVKVAIIDPPDNVRPEMLAQVVFLAPKSKEAPKSESEDRLRILAPRQLVEGGEDRAQVWVVDSSTKTARRQTVTIGRAGTDELVEISDGLSPTDKLISGGRETLTDGARISITGEDPNLGSSSRNTAVAVERTANSKESTRTN